MITIFTRDTLRYGEPETYTYYQCTNCGGVWSEDDPMCVDPDCILNKNNCPKCEEPCNWSNE